MHLLTDTKRRAGSRPLLSSRPGGAKMSVELPQPTAAYIAGSNAHDADACAACFTDRAVVRDEGREMQGTAAIRQWMDAAIRKYEHVVEVLTCAEADGKTIVTGRVSGNFPNSPVELRYAFTLAGGKIARLEIA